MSLCFWIYSPSLGLFEDSWFSSFIAWRMWVTSDSTFFVLRYCLCSLLPAVCVKDSDSGYLFKYMCHTDCIRWLLLKLEFHNSEVLLWKKSVTVRKSDRSFPVPSPIRFIAVKCFLIKSMKRNITTLSSGLRCIITSSQLDTNWFKSIKLRCHLNFHRWP